MEAEGKPFDEKPPLQTMFTKIGQGMKEFTREVNKKGLSLIKKTNRHFPPKTIKSKTSNNDNKENIDDENEEVDDSKRVL